MILLLDVDEVLVDFVGAVCQMFGKDTDVIQKNRNGQWSITPALGVTDSEMWAEVTSRGSAFWENLEEHPWCDELISHASRIFGRQNWYLCSSPSHDVTSYTGKVNWIKKKFGRNFNQFFLTHHKTLLAMPGRLLVDDRHETVVKFTMSGGLSLLFPTHGGILSEYASNPLEWLIPQLERVAR